MPERRPLDRSATARVLDEVLPILAGRLGRPELVPMLREAFLGALGSLARYRFTELERLASGDEGLELLHELALALLEGRVGVDPRRSLSRVVANAGYHLLRRPRWRRAELHDEHAVPDPQGVCPEPGSGLSSAGRELHDQLQALPLPTLSKGSGRLHLGDTGRSLGLHPRVLRRRIRALGQELGRDAGFQGFWFARLADAVHELLREQCEAELGDLCGTRRLGEPAIHRLRRVLDRFTSLGSTHSFAAGLPARERKRRALRLLRTLARESRPSARRLLAAGRLLQPGHPRFALIQAERLRGAGRPAAALRVLRSCDRSSGSARQRLLLCLAEARCLDSLGRSAEASDLLERHAVEQRGELLYSYNRFVLATRAGLPARAADARKVLHRHAGEVRGLSPLLLRGIRLALAGGCG